MGPARQLLERSLNAHTREKVNTNNVQEICLFSTLRTNNAHTLAGILNRASELSSRQISSHSTFFSIFKMASSSLLLARQLIRLSSIRNGMNTSSRLLPIRCLSQETGNNQQVLTIQQPQVTNDEELLLLPFSRLNNTNRPYLEDLAPPQKRSFNLAAYVNSTKTLQELIKLRVSLYDIESNNVDASKHLVGLDFEKDCAPYIAFLVDQGLKPRNLGRFISEYPSIFTVPIEELQTRIAYLKSKGFSAKQISAALNRSSQILVNYAKTLDFKLGQLQVEFKMPAEIIRSMVSKYPPIVSLPHAQYRLIHFCLAEEFGFKLDEMHTILEEQPKIFDIIRPNLIDRLNLIHNVIGLSHATITKFPKLITGPRFDIKHRFEYLLKLKRNQFNPKLPLYVPPSALYKASDEEFCERYAKTSLEDLKLFLKSC